MSDLIAHAPKKIYLQHDVEDEGHPFPKDWDGDEVTWCRDRQAESDVEYLRADVAAAALRQKDEQIAGLQQAYDELADRHDDAERELAELRAQQPSRP